jgi:hypothetical protein
MSAAQDWYYTVSFFGYEITIPDDTTYRKFCRELYGYEGCLQPPFEITGIISEFNSLLDASSLNDKAKIVIGFKPSNDINETLELSKQLAEYIVDNPIFEGLIFSDKPQFFSGIDWYSNIEMYDDDTSDTSDESEAEDESEEDTFGEEMSEETSEDDDKSIGIQEYKN